MNLGCNGCGSLYGISHFYVGLSFRIDKTNVFKNALDKIPENDNMII